MNWTEKFQTTQPPPPADRDEWTSLGSVRVVNPQSYSNEMPLGYMTDDKTTEFTRCAAGETDVSKDTSQGSVNKGYTRLDMKGTDDLYTGEHADQFYGDAGGFCERNNYLDRM